MTVPKLGAWREGSGVRWRVWAPEHERLDVVLFEADGRTERQRLPLRSEGGGYFSTLLAEAPANVFYKIGVDGAGPWPDPWSEAQPFGVHGPSEVLPNEPFEWHDPDWRGLPLEDLIIYEVHVGTATPEGTFDALIGKLDLIRELGVTAVELMPLASFPGKRNWGYDGVSLNAPSMAYGGPTGLKRFIDAAHQRGLAVLIDAVYNHLGPDGNYLGCYSSRYFTARHKTPWGDGVNYDGADAAPVRELVLRNAELWIRDYHADGLRLDATHAIQDDSPVHILREVGERARKAADMRHVLVVAEDERNEAKVILPTSRGGYGLDAVWADDFHHQMRRAWAGDHDGYFEDFTGTTADLAKTIEQGWFYTGQFAPHYGKPRGSLPGEIEFPRFVQCIQNHDQIGNRAFGDRLSEKVDPAAFKAMSALLLFSPGTPLLFMGQEWNATTPFIYFTDHNPELGKAVTEGRRQEFAKFAAFAKTDIPDPQSKSTFDRSKLNWAEREHSLHRGVWEWYRTLIELRKTHPCLRDRRRSQVHVEALGPETIAVHRHHNGRTLTLFVALRGEVHHAFGRHGCRWIMSSEDPAFGGDRRVELHDEHLLLGRGPVAVLYEC